MGLRVDGTSGSHTEPTVRRWRRSFWISAALAFVGASLFLYGHALGALLLSSCPRFGWTAPGRCAWPYQFVVIGATIAITATGAAVLSAVSWFANRPRKH
jgi:hypothetical protein